MSDIRSFVSLIDKGILPQSHQGMDREKLHTVIRQWNSERLDLFEISQPDEELVFHGVMRFYLQDHTEGNVATKCIRISSTSTTKEVIETLLEKFRPDVSTEYHSYSMYEVCGEDEGRRLDLNEKPLMVQLNWSKNTTEGRFILKNDSNVNLQTKGMESNEKLGVIQNFRRTMSKKQKANKQKSKESPNNCLTETDELSNGNMICQNSHKQEKRTKVEKPAEPECRVLQNEEMNSEPDSHNSRLQWKLPLSIKLQEKKEEAFLLAIVNYINSSTVHFKLSPAYAFYLASRFVLTKSEERNEKDKKTAQRVATFVNKIVNLMDKAIQKQKTITVVLTFWLANASEFLNFIKQDCSLATKTLHPQNVLAQLVQKTFMYLSDRLKTDLEIHLPTFVTDTGEQRSQATGIDTVLATFNRAMSLLRRFRVNPALSIQLFSQLFHFMGAWLLNRLTMAASGSNLCSHYWGMTLHERLNHVEAWAERQGLELAADCYLSRIIQATTLLTMKSYAIKDAQKIHSTCFKLNSLQLRAIMTKYHSAPKQPHIPHGLIESVVAMAETTENRVLKEDGRDIRMEEDLYLHLPFLLPEEGYSCEILQGIPQGFKEFLEPICHKVSECVLIFCALLVFMLALPVGLCTLIAHRHSLGSWTIYFQMANSVSKNSDCQKLETVKMTMKKPLLNGMGISIVAAKGAGQEKLGIFIKSVVHGGPADVDGRLAPGDQLLSVDGKSLIGISQERAAEIMVSTGSSVTLEVAKLAAAYYSLEEKLNQLSQGTLTDSNRAMHTSKGLEMEHISEIVCGPSTLLCVKGKHRTAKRTTRDQDQKWLKHRIEYRSNPNLACGLQNSEEMSVGSVLCEQMITSVSTDNILSAQKPESVISNFHPDEIESYREYLTLPTRFQGCKATRTTEQHHLFSRGQDNITLMKQAHSQENLSHVDRGGPLLDRPLFLDQLHDHPLSECNISGPERRNRDKDWKISTDHSTPLSQPKRIDVPVSLPTDTKSFGAFRQPVLAANSRNTSCMTTTDGQVRNHHQISVLPNHHLQQHTGPILAYKKPLQSYISTQKTKPIKIDETMQSAVCQSFHKSQNTSEISSLHPTDTPGPQAYRTVKKSDAVQCTRDGLSPDPWKREAREQLEKQQRHQAVELLEQEVMCLQAKQEWTLEESKRLRRLSLEWQFQKRLKEFKQNEDIDEEEDATIMPQPELQCTKQFKARECHHGQNWSENQNHLLNQEKAGPAEKDSVTDKVSGVYSETNKFQHVRVSFGELPDKSFQNVRAPENLTFRERQQIFSLAMNETNKVEVS